MIGLGVTQILAWIQQIRKTQPIPAREVLLNQGLEFAMQWGSNWMKPIQERLSQRFPRLSPEQVDELNATCQAAMKFGHDLVYALAEKSGKNTRQEDFVQQMSEVYPWVNEKNASHLFSQGMYYAWKDMGFV
jgi:hypothetical protein